MAEHVNCAHDPEGADGNPFAATICAPSGSGPEISSHPDCECPGGAYRRFVDRDGPCPLHGGGVSAPNPLPYCADHAHACPGPSGHRPLEGEIR